MKITPETLIPFLQGLQIIPYYFFSKFLRESTMYYLNMHNSTIALMFNRIFHFILYSQLEFILITVAHNYEHILTTYLKECRKNFVSWCRPWKNSIIACHSKKIKNHFRKNMNWTAINLNNFNIARRSSMYINGLHQTGEGQQSPCVSLVSQWLNSALWEQAALGSVIGCLTSLQPRACHESYCTLGWLHDFKS